MPLKIEYQHFASPCSRVELGTLEECCIDSPVSCHWFEVERPSRPQWCQQLHTRKPSCCVVSCAPTVSSAACTTVWWEQCYHGAVTFSPTKGPWSSRVHRILGKQQADKWRHSGVGGGVALTFKLVFQFPQWPGRSVSERESSGVSAGWRLCRLLLQPAGSRPQQELCLFWRHSGTLGIHFWPSFSNHNCNSIRLMFCRAVRPVAVASQVMLYMEERLLTALHLHWLLVFHRNQKSSAFVAACPGFWNVAPLMHVAMWWSSWFCIPV